MHAGILLSILCCFLTPLRMPLDYFFTGVPRGISELPASDSDLILDLSSRSVSLLIWLGVRSHLTLLEFGDTRSRLHLDHQNVLTLPFFGDRVVDFLCSFV